MNIEIMGFQSTDCLTDRQTDRQTADAFLVMSVAAGELEHP